MGISGLVGAGRTEVLKGIFGCYKLEEGTVKVNNKEITIKNTKVAIKNSIGLVPEDRRHEGLLLEKNITENISLPSICIRSKRGFVDKKWEIKTAKKFVDMLYIKTPSIYAMTGDLSGGNQQKVVIAKWMAP